MELSGLVERPSYTKRRTFLACKQCRARRTRCNGQRPKCLGCQNQNAECVYPQAPDPQPSPLEQELSSIKQRLDYIASTITHAFHPSPIQMQMQNVGGPIPFFPFLAVKSPLLMRFLGLDPGLSEILYRLENPSSGCISGITRAPRASSIPYERAITALHAFSEHVHRWYPILHPNFTSEFFDANTNSFPPSNKSCQSLLVAAIGFLVAGQTMGSASSLQTASCYFDAAQSMLYFSLLEDDWRSTQCLVLVSLYFSCLLRPRQAHDFAILATSKVQKLLKIEISTQIDLGVDTSRIHHRDYMIPFPERDTDVWNFTSQFKCDSPRSLMSGTFENEAGEDRVSYLLKAVELELISQRYSERMSTNGLNGHHHQTTPITADEQAFLLEEWFESIPQTLRFSEAVVARSSPTTVPASRSPLVDFLRLKYYELQVSIYWQYVYRVVENGVVADADVLVHSRLFFDSVMNFLSLATVIAPRCGPKLWSLYTSVFIICLATLKVQSIECFKVIAQPKVFERIQHAVQSIRRPNECGRSLGFMWCVLEEQLRNLKAM
ncbi:hypothetical protein BGW36DRAFT_447416 [Talaromyces proteolyticus]|uniref:Zn(2)-C6 fungal-type domain-containing protein n=1 Tax=Talaromyces proteolyticus TaxID=1131652 RepID=A0AAD4KYZ7_9EURO|nr:uncharacterized protein BGW36DRAFT_447416 [Talaromyces proteolyticus]KAH8700646.1 hypothetical protein BGW36DRAFT_447416 [Talaromyces proteolyticus]